MSEVQLALAPSFPVLSGVIEKDDVFQKGTGNYAASYVAWARIANYLHTHAPGWQFHLEPAPGGGFVWKAPNGTGFLMSHFTGPLGEITSSFPFPIMDNRNNPIKFEQISARDFTDAHRRALCANAAFTFSLGYELWAKEEVEQANAPAPVQQPAPSSTPAPKSANTISDAQIKRLFAITQEKNLTNEQAKEVIARYGFASSRDITKDSYDIIVEAIRNAG